MAALLKYIERDITSVNVGVIAHVVNDCGVMGAGVAKALYTRWPAVRSNYLDFCRVVPKSSRLGRVNFVPISDEIVVANMFAQQGYGRDGRLYLRYDQLEETLEQVAGFSLSSHMPLYIPSNMGCGLARGDWGRVSEIIADVCPGATICRKEWSRG